MLGEWPEATEAALCAEYGGNPIRDFWRGKITLRELRVKVENLPPDSAVFRREPSSAGWQPGDHLLADLFDAVNTLLELTAAKWTGQETFKPPAPHDRPGLAEARAEQEKARKAALDKAIRRVRQIEAIVIPKG